MQTYYITKRELQVIRHLCSLARLPWRTIAARPMLAEHWVHCYDEAGGNWRLALEQIAKTAER